MNAGAANSAISGRKRPARPCRGPQEALPAAATPAGQHGRVSLTVRIDRTLHARLRALAVRQQRTHQDIVEGALDAYLNVFGAGCPCTAGAKPKA